MGAFRSTLLSLVRDRLTEPSLSFLYTGRASLISHLHYLSTLSQSYPLLTMVRSLPAPPPSSLDASLTLALHSPSFIPPPQLTNHSIPTSKTHNTNNTQPYPFPSRISRTNTRPALDSVFSHLTDLTLWLELPTGYAGERGKQEEGWVVVAQVLRNRIGVSLKYCLEERKREGEGLTSTRLVSFDGRSGLGLSLLFIP